MLTFYEKGFIVFGILVLVLVLMQIHRLQEFKKEHTSQIQELSIELDQMKEQIENNTTDLTALLNEYAYKED